VFSKLCAACLCLASSFHRSLRSFHSSLFCGHVEAAVVKMMLVEIYQWLLFWILSLASALDWCRTVFSPRLHNNRLLSLAHLLLWYHHLQLLLPEKCNNVRERRMRAQHQFRRLLRFCSKPSRFIIFFNMRPHFSIPAVCTLLLFSFF